MSNSGLIFPVLDMYIMLCVYVFIFVELFGSVLLLLSHVKHFVNCLLKVLFYK